MFTDGSIVICNIPDTNDAIEFVFHASHHIFVKIVGPWQLVILQCSGTYIFSFCIQTIMKNK